MSAIQLLQITPEQLEKLISDVVKTQISELKNALVEQQSSPYLSRKQLAAHLHINLSTIHNWTKKGTLKPIGVEGRVLYKRSDIEAMMVQLS